MNKTYESLEQLATSYKEKVLKYLSEKNELNKEKVNVFISPLEEAKGEMLEALVYHFVKEKGTDLEDDEAFTAVFYEILEIFEYYEFYEQQLAGFFETYEPRGCDYDKAHFVLEHYIHSILSKQTPTEDSFSHPTYTFHIPKMKKAELWMAFVSSMTQLRMGKPKQYIRIYQEIVEYYTQGVEEKNNHLQQLVKTIPQYVKTEKENDEIIHSFASGEETAQVKVNIVGDYKLSFWTPEMKGIRLVDKINKKLKFESPEWVKDIQKLIQSP